jgi:hypothetical protein
LIVIPYKVSLIGVVEQFFAEVFMQMEEKAIERLRGMPVGYSPHVVSRILGYNRTSVYRLINQGHLDTFRGEDNRLYVYPDSVGRYIGQREQEKYQPYTKGE